MENRVDRADSTASDADFNDGNFARLEAVARQASAFRPGKDSADGTAVLWDQGA